MPATPKSLRQPPPRNFEDYSLTYETSPELGLFPLRNEEMEYIPGPVGESGVDLTYSDEQDIGFLFSFNGSVYDRFVVSTSGWCALLPPAYTFSITDFFTAGVAQPTEIYINQGCLLVPWFPVEVQNTYRYADDAYASGDLTSDERDLLKAGKITIDPARQQWVDSTSGGVKVHRGNSTAGRHLLIRWHMMGANTTNVKSTLRFDMVVYESGVIEYRYAPISVPVASDLRFPTAVGVWITQANINYRDFSNYLKEDVAVTPGDERAKYKYGGAVWNGSYADSLSPTTPYSVSVDHVKYWPAGGTSGAVFRFEPPINRRRKNRRTIAARDSKPISPAGTFDDRKTTYFVTDTVSYPAGLPVGRPYSTGYKDVHKVIDLFSLEEIQVSRTGSSSLYDQLLEETLADAPEDGFREVALHEQGSFGDDFYSVGSSVTLGKEPGDFSSALNQKETLRLSFPVRTQTNMLGLTSSIYYFNRELGRWNFPTRSLGDISDPFGSYSFDTRWLPGFGTTVQKFTPGSFISEDARGFDAYGRPIASGSTNIFRTVYTASNPGEFNQTIPLLGRGDVTGAEVVTALAERYTKSVTQNPEYAATSEETFSLPITEPFLIEKAVFEIPFSMGLGWFEDVTTTTTLLVSSTYEGAGGPRAQLFVSRDRGGPLITVSLLCEKNGIGGRSYDLIATGTITNQNDYRAMRACKILPSSKRVPEPTILFSQLGVVNPGHVVRGNNFTGSIALRATAGVSNGVSLGHSRIFTVNSAAPPTPATPLSTWSPTYAISWFSNLLFNSSSTYTYNASDPNESLHVLGVNPLGRSMAGFSPGGGSIFGGDNVTYPEVLGPACKFSNPYLIVSSSTAFDDISAAINDLAAMFPTKDINVFMTADVDAHGRKDSPYLVKPGDRLVLAVSKHRPAYNFLSSSVASPAAADIGRGSIKVMEKLDINCTLSSVVPHDVSLITGSINISLYGSYVADNRGRS